ncbi:MAG: hypothetical protein ACI92E_002540, partial [Oceanicoccus sp.]
NHRFLHNKEITTRVPVTDMSFKQNDMSSLSAPRFVLAAVPKKLQFRTTGTELPHAHRMLMPLNSGTGLYLTQACHQSTSWKNKPINTAASLPN